MDIDAHSYCPRRRELADCLRGRVVRVTDSGQKRPDPKTGNPSIVWVITPTPPEPVAAEGVGLRDFD